MTAPCFLVHPVPSVADDSFLQLLFDRHVSRSIFAGFGLKRFAIVEVNDATFAADVAQELERQQREELLMDNAEMTRRGLAAVDAAADEELLFPTAGDTPSTSTAPSHLGKLCWNGGYKIRVCRSPISVEDFFQVGGVVPQHAVEKQRSGGKRPRQVEQDDAGNSSPAKKRPAPAGKSAADTSEPATKEVSAPPPVKKVFDKGCCQKCGSSAHFTRNCDGSGESSAAPEVVPTTAPTAPATRAEAPKQEHKKREEPKPVTRAEKPPAPVRTSKDQCKHCGSDAHLSRHCPSK